MVGVRSAPLTIRTPAVAAFQTLSDHQKVQRKRIYHRERGADNRSAAFHEFVTKHVNVVPIAEARPRDRIAPRLGILSRQGGSF